jgi:hypothetical protein
MGMGMDLQHRLLLSAKRVDRRSKARKVLLREHVTEEGTRERERERERVVTIARI